MSNLRKKRGLPYGVVAVIADQLVAKGFKPNEISAGAIRDETGTGSLTTISNHLNDWRARDRPVVPGVTLDVENLSGVVAEITALIGQASERVREECRTAAVGEAIEKANLHAELADALRVNEEIEAEREAIAAEIEPLKVALDDAKLLVADLEGQLKGQARALAVLERATTRDYAEASAIKLDPAEQPVDPARAAVLAVPPSEQRSAGERAEEAGRPERETPPVIKVDHGTGDLAKMPYVPEDDAVQANVDREDRG